jgi:hypothetical protein
MPAPRVWRGLAEARLIGRAEVEVKKGGIQVAAEQEAAVLVPMDRRAGPAAVLSKLFLGWDGWLHVQFDILISRASRPVPARGRP